jgi:hypothetical protein
MCLETHEASVLDPFDGLAPLHLREFLARNGPVAKQGV